MVLERLADMRVSQDNGYLFEGSYDKDESMMGSLLKSPFLRKLPHNVQGILDLARVAAAILTACAKVSTILLPTWYRQTPAQIRVCLVHRTTLLK